MKGREKPCVLIGRTMGAMVLAHAPSPQLIVQPIKKRPRVLALFQCPSLFWLNASGAGASRELVLLVGHLGVPLGSLCGTF